MITALAEFLRQSPLTLVEQAAEWEIDNSHLSRLANGHKQPSLKLALVIEQGTNGAVPLESWEKFAQLKHRVRAPAPKRRRKRTWSRADIAAPAETEAA